MLLIRVDHPFCVGDIFWYITLKSRLDLHRKNMNHFQGSRPASVLSRLVQCNVVITLQAKSPVDIRE